MPFIREDEEENKKKLDAPYSPEVTGVNNSRSKPRSTDPISAYEDQLEEARKLDTPTDDEVSLGAQATDLSSKPEDAEASMWARLGDITAQTASNYAKASGAAVSDKPFNEATSMVSQKLALKENLRKNLLERVQAAKADREAKRKSLYEQIGTGMRIAGEGRAVAQEQRDVSKFETMQKEIARQDDPLTQQQIKMYEGLAKQRGVIIDLSTAKQRNVSDIEKAIGLGIRPENTTTAAKGLDQPLTNEQIDLINAERAKRNARPIPYGTTMRSVEAIEGASDVSRRHGIGLGQPATERFDPMQVVRGSAQEREYKILSDEARKTKEKQAQNAGELQQLNSLLMTAESGNPVAASAAQRQIAMMFNKGALSDQDVIAFSGSRQIIDRLNRWANANITNGAPLTKEDLQQFKAIIPELAKGTAKATSMRESDIRRRAASVHPGLGDYIFGGQSSTGVQKDVTPQSGDVKKRFTVDGQPRELTKDEFERLKASGARITR